MSECVVRMEMPQGCEDCPFMDFQLCCSATGCKYVGGSLIRPDWCPILCQLPEGHGRLIDADEFSKRAIGTQCFPEDDSRMLQGLVGESITIVPAERSEHERND